MGTFASRVAQRQLLNLKSTPNVSPLMHHYSYRNKQTEKRSLHEVTIWLMLGAEPIPSSNDWMLTTNLIEAAGKGLYQPGAETMNCSAH